MDASEPKPEKGDESTGSTDPEPNRAGGSSGAVGPAATQEARGTARAELQESARSTIGPAIDEVCAAPVIGDDGTNELLCYYMKAAEFGALADDQFDDLGMLDLPPTDDTLVTHAREALWDAAKIARGDCQGEALESLGRNLQALTDAYTEIQGAAEIAADFDTVAPDTHPEDTKWRKHSNDGRARLEHPFQLIHADRVADEYEMFTEILEILGDEIPISMSFKGERGDEEITAAVTSYLTPDQAEAFGRALIETAEGLREESDQ